MNTMDRGPRKSVLTDVGVVLVMVSIVGGILGSRCAAALSGAVPSLLIGMTIDLARACFIVGPGCYLIGRLRNSRWRREHEAAVRNSQSTSSNES